MRNQRTVSLNNAIPIPAADYVYIPMHETTGSNIAVHGKNGDTVFDPRYPNGGTAKSLPIVGFSSDAFWTAEASYATPEGDNYVVLSDDSDIDAILQPPTTGGMLFLYTQKLDDPTLEDGKGNNILGWGRANSATGGYFLQLADNANQNSQINFYDAIGGNETAGIQVTALKPNAVATYHWANMDSPTGGLVSGYGPTLDNQDTADVLTQPTSRPTGYAALLFAASNNSGTPGTNSEYNKTMTGHIRDLYVIKFDSFPSTDDLSRIIDAYTSAPSELIRGI